MLSEVEQCEVGIALQFESCREGGLRLHALLSRGEHGRPEAVPTKGKQSAFNGEVAPTALVLDWDRFAVKLDSRATPLERGNHGSAGRPTARQ